MREYVSEAFVLVMCSMERIDDFDPTPTTVSPIPASAIWEPLVPPRVGVVRSRSSLGRSHPELFRSQRRTKSAGVDQRRSQPE